MSAKNIRVCQIVHGIVGGGSEQVVLNYCSRMSDIHFDLLYQYEPNPQILERFNEARINCIQIPDKIHHPLKHLWTMFKLFRQGKYDVVHSHLDWYMNSYVCFLAMLAGIKKRFAHHHQAYTKRNLLCAIMRLPCKLFATHWLACGKAAAINGWGKTAVKKGRVTILPNAIDPERFKFNEIMRHDIRAQYGMADDDFVIGHVGRFFPQKNHEFLIDIFVDVYKQNPNTKLLLVGDGPLLEKIRKKNAELKLTGSVIFVGLQKDSAPFYSAMDAFAFPSLWEGLPLTLIEAQYNGLQCVVSEKVTIEAAITKNIYFLSTKDTEPWHKTLNCIRTKNVQRIIEICNNQFDIRQNCKMLESLYQIPQF